MTLLAGCAHPQKTAVEAHWIDENESAPFTGLLIDEATYKSLRMKLLRCENR